MEHLLTVENLCASVGGKPILNGIDLTVNPGEVHALMGPNGAGKSTLGSVIVGNPAYTVDSGKLFFDGQDITDKPADVRARSGIFLSFQNPPEIGGITVSSFLRTAVEQRRGGRIRLIDFKRELKAAMQLLEMNEEYAERELNVGFSGGERKKSEILQLLMLRPCLAVLDETDSGLDVDAVRLVSKGIGKYLEETGGSLIVITHNTSILESVKVDYTHILVNGKIVRTGSGKLTRDVLKNGFADYE